MNPDRTVRVFDTRTDLVGTIADDFVATISESLRSRAVAHVVLTGGTVGYDVLAAISEEQRQSLVDWSRIHLWWGDERWLPSGDAERNDAQAALALLRHISIPEENVHRFPASDGAFDLDAAAVQYARELTEYFPDSTTPRRFDLVFLGVGPDGHIASLFPGLDGIKATTAGVVSVRNSPKPPPERLSLTLPMINSADQIWLCLAGADKASALGLALAGASVPEVPAAGAAGLMKTLFFVDATAAAEVPSELLDSNRSAKGQNTLP